MSDCDDFMCEEEEDYGLEYSEDSNSEPDVDLENQYYNSKALKEDEPNAALTSFQKVLDLESGDKGEWGFKALKQMIKINFKLNNYAEMMNKYKQLLTYIKSAVTRNHSEKSINSILDYISTSKNVAMVEVNLSDDMTVPEEMLVLFTVCTTLLVAVHMLALMISTCILPNIDAVCSLNTISLVHESPHERLHWFIETAWAFSTLLGLILFLFEIAILCWVKFYDISKYAAYSACIVLIPVLIIFIAFAVHFYRTMVAHRYEVTRSGIRELELLKEQIECGGTASDRLNGLSLDGINTRIV